MRKEDLQVGTLVKANKISNDAYAVTTERFGCVGVVQKIFSDGTFRLKITEHHDSKKIGNEYVVECECFDCVRQVGITFEAKEEAEEVFEIKAGDIVITSKGVQVLVYHDFDDSTDLRGVLLNTLRMTDYFRNVRELNEELSEEGFGKVVRVVNKENYVIKEK